MGRYRPSHRTRRCSSGRYENGSEGCACGNPWLGLVGNWKITLLLPRKLRLALVARSNGITFLL